MCAGIPSDIRWLCSGFPADTCWTDFGPTHFNGNSYMYRQGADVGIPTMFHLFISPTVLCFRPHGLFLLYTETGCF